MIAAVHHGPADKLAGNSPTTATGEQAMSARPAAPTADSPLAALALCRCRPVQDNALARVQKYSITDPVKRRDK